MDKVRGRGHLQSKSTKRYFVHNQSCLLERRGRRLCSRGGIPLCLGYLQCLKLREPHGLQQSFTTLDLTYRSTLNPVSRHLRLFLTGHGYFKSYLNRWARPAHRIASTAPAFPTTRNTPSSDVCVGKVPAWMPQENSIFSVDTVCKKIMEDEGNWDCLSQFVRGILLEMKPDLDRAAG
ncbi:hypothetical protein J6590_058904 [Homalodisca vitripennis]|nr:hypothetical protein J6590_058904 [Homalodisca vitripennis]